jgi:hypothetical protein
LLLFSAWLLPGFLQDDLKADTDGPPKFPVRFRYLIPASASSTANTTASQPASNGVDSTTPLPHPPPPPSTNNAGKCCLYYAFANNADKRALILGSLEVLLCYIFLSVEPPKQQKNPRKLCKTNFKNT